MDTLLTITRVVIALGLLNVWLVRFNKPTPYRGGAALSMREEFAVYGLPRFVLWTVGTLKVLCAAAFIAGIWVPALVAPAAGVLSLLMIGAIAMHVKVHDPLVKSVPAGAVLALVSLVLAGSFF